MKPDQFDQQNFTFVKPNGMTDEECRPLTVYKGPHPDGTGQPVVISKWVDPATGASVYVHVFGYGIPPMYIGTENPFEQNHATSEHKVGYIITLNKITPSVTVIEWMKKLIAGERSFTNIYLTTITNVKNSDLLTEKSNFITGFINPWNILFKDDQISY